MVYLVAVVIAAYTCDRVTAVASAVAAVTAFNFFFVPPRYGLAVENHEHLIVLGAMLKQQPRATLPKLHPNRSMIAGFLTTPVFGIHTTGSEPLTEPGT
jgi:hypothetical protein